MLMLRSPLGAQLKTTMASSNSEEMGPLSPGKLENSLIEPDDGATKDFIFQQTMYRIKDPEVSLKFYTGVLGMRLVKGKGPLYGIYLHPGSG